MNLPEDEFSDMDELLAYKKEFHFHDLTQTHGDDASRESLSVLGELRAVNSEQWYKCTREGKCSQPLKQVFRQYKINLRNIAEYFYSIRVLFTLYLVQLDNNELYLRSSENKA